MLYVYGIAVKISPLMIFLIVSMKGCYFHKKKLKPFFLMIVFIVLNVNIILQFQLKEIFCGRSFHPFSVQNNYFPHIFLRIFWWQLLDFCCATWFNGPYTVLTNFTLLQYLILVLPGSLFLIIYGQMCYFSSHFCQELRSTPHLIIYRPLQQLPSVYQLDLFFFNVISQYRYWG